MRIGTIAVGCATLAFSLAYLHAIGDLPAPLDPEDIGPRRFPNIIAVLLVVLSLLLIAEAWFRGKGELVKDPATWRAGALFLLCVAYVAAVPLAGYLVATLIWIAAAVWLLGGRWLAPVTAVGFVAFIYGVFEQVLGVPVP
ncbi:MAG: tripartite tricarboxylate transporter TctB family protein [Acetobacterales bacterium]